MKSKQALFILLALSLAAMALFISGSSPVSYAQEPGWTLYEDEVYGYSIEYPEGWELKPTVYQGNIATIIAPNQSGKVEIGVFKYDKPTNISLEDWLQPNDKNVRILSQTTLLINGIQVVKQDIQSLGEFRIYHFLQDNKVFFIQGTPSSQLDNIANSFEFTATYTKKQERVTNLYPTLDKPESGSVRAAIPSGFRLPFIGYYRVTQGPLCPYSHNGGLTGAIDFSMNLGEEIRATQSGTVTFAGWSGGYGKKIVIDHGNGNTSLYAHLHEFGVSIDQVVQKGQVIGYAGSTGNSTGNHLHFEVRHNNTLIFLTDIPGLTWTYWENDDLNRPCGGDATGPLIETNPPQAQIIYPAWGSIYSADNHFIDGNKIRIYAEAEDGEGDIDRVELVGFYTANGDTSPGWHQITASMSKDSNNPKGYYFDWNIDDIPDQYDFIPDHEQIRLDIKAYDIAGNLAPPHPVPIGLLRRVGRGTAYQDKYIAAYKQANTFIKPGATIVNRHGHMEPYWWPSSTASYRIVRQDFQYGSIVHNQCGLRENNDLFTCPPQDNPADNAYFVPADIMALYEDMVAHPTNYDNNYHIGVPISNAFTAAPDPDTETDETGFGMRFGQDTGYWIKGTWQYSDDSLWRGDIYYSHATRVANEIHGGIFKKYHEIGGTGSKLGFPRSNELEADPSPQGVSGRLNRFAHGEIYWRANDGETYFITEGFFSAFTGTGGSMGFPKSDVHGKDGEVQRIEFDNDCLELFNGNITTCECPGLGRSTQDAARDCMEPNDNFNDAIEITHGAEHSAFCYIGRSGDVDYYKIYLEADHTVEAKLYDLPQDYDLYLYRPNQSWLAQSKHSGTTDEELTANITGSGYYYLIINSPHNSYSDTQPYKFKVTAHPNALYPDLASTNLQADISQTRVGRSVQFETEIKNQGNILAGAMEISVYEEGAGGENPQLIETATIWPLSPAAQQSFVFNHTFDIKGERQIRLVLDSQGQIVEGNEDNNITLATLLACINGDFNCNEIIDIGDIQSSAGRWNLNIGETDYNTEYDLNLNGIIDISDIQWVAGRWNQTETRANQASNTKPISTNVTLALTPTMLNLEIGQTAILTLSAESLSDLGAFESAFNFDPDVITVTNVTMGADKSVYSFLPPKIVNTAGKLFAGAYSVGVNDSGLHSSPLIFVELQAVSSGKTEFRLSNASLVNSAGSKLLTEGRPHTSIQVVSNDTIYKTYLPIVLR